MIRNFIPISFLVLSVPLALSACVSIGEGGKPPAALLTLAANQTVNSVSERRSADGAPIVITLPVAPRSIDTIRVPVQVDDTSIAYVKQAVWADKPTRLFHALLREHMGAQTGRLVLPLEETTASGAIIINGTVMQFGYDARSLQAVMRYDVLLRHKDGSIINRRFENSVPVSAVEPGLIGAALNQAANNVAADVSKWVKSQI